MNITFLIGNGFDVSMGIESSYAKFYDWYCNEKTDKNHIKEFRDNINKDVKSDKPDEEKYWADFELGLGKYTENFDKETVDQYLECVEDAQLNIRNYLVNKENSFNLDQFTEDSIEEFTKSIWNFYDEIADMEKETISTLLKSNSNENRNVRFVTFNYTGTLERIFEKIPNQPLHTWKSGSSTYSYNLNRSVIHLHGTTNEFPVLGLYDATQISNKELLETPLFSQYLIKALNIQSLGRLWYRQASECIRNSKIICLFGLSLGETDAKWWVELTKWLRGDSTRQIILYWFEKNPPNGISSIRQLRLVNDVQEKLLSYSELSEEEIVTLKSRIHVVINTSKFLNLKRKETNITLVDEEKDVEMMENLKMQINIK